MRLKSLGQKSIKNSWCRYLLESVPPHAMYFSSHSTGHCKEVVPSLPTTFGQPDHKWKVLMTSWFNYLLEQLTELRETLTLTSFFFLLSFFFLFFFFFFFFFFVFFVFFSFFWAPPEAYGGSQARGLIGAAAAGLHQSHSNSGSEPCLRPTPQLMAMLDS